MERLKRLEEFEERFSRVLQNNFTDSFDEALFNTIKQEKLDPSLFLDLLKAFKQDIVKKRYATFNELLDYCSKSANPVGRLMLQLLNIRDEAAYVYSDKICTALQLTNFLQDVSVDFKKGRIYIPQEDLSYFGIEESYFESEEINNNFRQLIKYNVERTGRLFKQGKNLLPFLSGRFKIEIKWTISGGEEVLNKIRKIDYNVLRIRPTLSKKDFIRLFLKSVL